MLPYHAALERALRAQGVDVLRLGPKVRYVVLRRGRNGRPDIVRRVPSPMFLLRLARAEAHVVVCTEFGLETLGAVLLSRVRGRRVLVFQEHAGRGGHALGRLDRAYRRLVVRLVDGLVANTNGAREELVGILRAPPGTVHRTTFLVPPHEHELLAAPLAVEAPSRRPVFLYVGRLVAQKNVVAILDAARTLAGEALAFEIWIVGSGDLEEDLRHRAGDLRVEDRVRFLGHVEWAALGHVYRRADAFVMPTARDYRNFAVLEAMRFGLAVIDSRADGNVGDFVLDGENALVFDPGDPSSLARCMRRIATEPGLARKLGDAGRRRLAWHTPERAAAEVRAVLTGCRPPPVAAPSRGGRVTRAR